MNPEGQKWFKAATRVVMAGEYNNNLYGIWKRYVLKLRDTKGRRNELLELIDQVSAERLENHEPTLQDQYFEILKAFFIMHNFELAAEYFDGLIADAEKNSDVDDATKSVYADAMCNRAVMYLKGQGGPVNRDEALRLFDRAIELNSAAAIVEKVRGLEDSSTPRNVLLLGHAIELGYCSEALSVGVSPGPIASPDAWATAVYFRDYQISLGYDIARARMARANLSINWGGFIPLLMARALIGLMWNGLLQNRPLVGETRKFLSWHEHANLVASKLKKSDDLKLLKRVMQPGQSIRRLLESESPGPLRKALKAVEEHVKAVEAPLFALGAVMLRLKSDPLFDANLFRLALGLAAERYWLKGFEAVLGRAKQVEEADEEKSDDDEPPHAAAPGV